MSARELIEAVANGESPRRVVESLDEGMEDSLATRVLSKNIPKTNKGGGPVNVAVMRKKRMIIHTDDKKYMVVANYTPKGTWKIVKSSGISPSKKDIPDKEFAGILTDIFKKY